ncbi:response regulator [Zobellia alginiliquefaciens]|uniref:response regulator n=1 Tax=Zobellia alginiliquefaciens TaxID=3032586 RepID=UPI0023E40589|nr:response regulator [Zobellia alginiliquefaciens]
MIKILIIEDDDVTNFISKVKLESLGFNDISVVTDGQMGVDYLKDNECPNLILLDINMPILDGWEFLAIKEKLGLCPNVPIIVTTSSGRPEDRLKACDFSAIVDYLEKPINFDTLYPYLLDLDKENLIC